MRKMNDSAKVCTICRLIWTPKNNVIRLYHGTYSMIHHKNRTVKKVVPTCRLFNQQQKKKIEQMSPKANTHAREDICERVSPCRCKRAGGTLRAYKVHITDERNKPKFSDKGCEWVVFGVSEGIWGKWRQDQDVWCWCNGIKQAMKVLIRRIKT